MPSRRSWPPFPPAPVIEVQRAYLVCATQRSGSTLLCELLKTTGAAGRPEEYFEAMRDTGIPPHPRDFLAGLARTGLGIRDDPEPPDAPAYSSLTGLPDYRAHLRRTRELGTTANGVFGAKLMFNQLPELRALAAGLPEFSGLELDALLGRLLGGVGRAGEVRYIWVSRRDKVRQAVSMWKALQTRRWQAGPTGERVAPRYRYEGIDHLVHRFEAEDEGWRRFFHRRGIEPLKITYEDDLESDAEAAVRRVLDWIGVVPPAGWRPQRTVHRQSDAVSDDWVAAYDRDRGAPPRAIARGGPS
jgi:LPS sulfotransferase NodH